MKRIACGSNPPDDVSMHPQFEQYWTRWDPIGGYADWYDEERLESRFGHLFTLMRYVPLTTDCAYVGAILVKR